MQGLDQAREGAVGVVEAAAAHADAVAFVVEEPWTAAVLMRGGAVGDGSSSPSGHCSCVGC